MRCLRDGSSFLSLLSLLSPSLCVSLSSYNTLRLFNALTRNYISPRRPWIRFLSEIKRSEVNSRGENRKSTPQPNRVLTHSLDESHLLRIREIRGDREACHFAFSLAMQRGRFSDSKSNQPRPKGGRRRVRDAISRELGSFPRLLSCSRCLLLRPAGVCRAADAVVLWQRRSSRYDGLRAKRRRTRKKEAKTPRHVADDKSFRRCEVI